MIKKISLFIVLIFSGIIIHAQIPNFNWIKHFGGSKYDNVEEITVDNSGSIYFGGEFYDTAFFDNYQLIVSGTFFMDNDAYIVKADSNGNVIWVRQIGGNSGQYITGIATDDSCNVFVTGIFQYPTTFGTFILTPTNTSNNDIFIAKYDSSGNFKWARKEGGSSTDKSYGICIDNSGNLIITGIFTTSYTFGNTTLSSVGQYDVFISKYNGNGTPLWAVQAGGSRSEYGYNIATDDFDNVYITGGFGSYGFSATFDDTTITPVSGMDAYVAKYDSSGNFLWVRQGGGNGNSGGGWGDEAKDIAIDDNNNVIITGIFWTTAYFGTDSITSNGMGDMFFAKYNGAGDLLFLVGEGGVSGDEGSAICTDQNNNIYVCGYFYGTAIFGDTSLINTGQLKYMFVVKYDSVGNFVWAKQGGLPSNANGTSANGIVTFNLFVYVCGSITDSASFDNQTVNSYGFTDGFVCQINSSMTTSLTKDITMKDQYSFSLYPNPTNGQIIIDLSTSLNQSANLYIYNIFGEHIITHKLKQKKTELNIADLPNGLYIFQLNSDNIYTKKIVKN